MNEAPSKRPWTIPAALAGVVAGAAMVGIAWLVLSPSAAAPTSAPLNPPDTLGGIDRMQITVAKISKRPDAAQQQVDQEDRADRENAARISAAYSGAAAASRIYMDPKAERGYKLTAVRAGSPGLVAVYTDTSLNVPGPFEEIRRFGDVECQIRSDQREPTAAPVAKVCQRTGPGLTVRLEPGFTTDGSLDPEKMAAAVAEAWDALA